jgi:hypothetical protein
VNGKPGGFIEPPGGGGTMLPGQLPAEQDAPGIIGGAMSLEADA